MGISYQWSLVVPALDPQVWTVQQPLPFPPLYFFTSPPGPWWIWVWRVDLHNCLQPTTACSLFFSFSFILLSLGSASSHQHSSQRTNYFLLPHFLPLFQLNHSPLPLSPLHPTDFLFSEVGDCLYNGEAWKARLSPSELGWLVFRKDYT